MVAYAAAHKLKVKDLYQWKTALTRRGFLPEKKPNAAFVPVAPAPTKVSATNCSVTLPNGVRVQFAGNLDGMLAELPKAGTVEDVEALMPITAMGDKREAA